MSQSSKPWTLMVYLAGDNNLSEEMVWSLQEMKKAASVANVNSKVNVIAQYDPRGKNPRTYDIIVDQKFPLPNAKDKDGDLDTLPIAVLSESQQYNAALEHIVEECLQASGQMNPATVQSVVSQLKKADDMATKLMTLLDPQYQGNAQLKEKIATLFQEVSDHLARNYSASAVLKTFIKDQIDKAIPAENYLVVLSGHGSGAIGDFLTDSDPQTALSIPKLRQLLELAEMQFKANREQEHTSRQSKEKKLIDILGMDSCLMGMAELCYEIRKHANYIVGSEGFVQNTGWPYHRILEFMASSPLPRQLAETIVQRYTCFYQDYEVAGASTDISAIDLKLFLPPANFIPDISNIAVEMTKSLKNVTVINELEELDINAENLKDELLQTQNRLKVHLRAKLEELKQAGDKIERLLERDSDDEKLLLACRKLDRLSKHDDVKDFLECTAEEILRNKKEKLPDPVRALIDAGRMIEEESASNTKQFLDQKKAEILNERKANTSSKMNELETDLRALVDAGGELKGKSAADITKWMDGANKHNVTKTNIEELEELFSSALGKGSILNEYLDKAGLQNETAAKKFVALLRYEASTKVKADKLEPRTVNALVELRLEIELCVYHDPVGFKSVLNDLDQLVAMGVTEARDLQEGLRHLASLKRMTELAEAVNLNIPANTRKEWTDVLNAIHLAHHEAQSYKGDLYTDLFDFCDRLAALLPSDRNTIIRKCTAIKDAINTHVFASCYAGPEFQHSHGVSLYFPWNALDYWHEYENLQFAQDTSWDEFLKSYLRATRRERRDASKKLEIEAITRRHGQLTYDPLMKAGTEDRIRAGTEDRIRAGTEDRIRAGTEDRIRAGTEDRIRAGTEDRIRGKLRFSSMKNPPDGFYRRDCGCKDVLQPSR